MDFIVHMWTGASTAVAQQTDGLTPFHRITFMDQGFFEVALCCFKPVAMIKQNVSAFFFVVTLNQHRTISSGFNI